MKSFFILVLSIFMAAPSFSQGAVWKVEQNGKLLLRSSVENEAKNIVRLEPATLKSAGNFMITYNEKHKEEGWNRHIALFDEKDNELIRQETASLKIPNGSLLQLLQNGGVIKVYTWALPEDPEEAARIRIRRVHLCTLR